jgi:hypothetical protein
MALNWKSSNNDVNSPGGVPLLLPNGKPDPSSLARFASAYGENFVDTHESRAAAYERLKKHIEEVNKQFEHESNTKGISEITGGRIVYKTFPQIRMAYSKNPIHPTFYSEKAKGVTSEQPKKVTKEKSPYSHLSVKAGEIYHHPTLGRVRVLHDATGDESVEFAVGKDAKIIGDSHRLASRPTLHVGRFLEKAKKIQDAEDEDDKTPRKWVMLSAKASNIDWYRRNRGLSGRSITPTSMADLDKVNAIMRADFEERKAAQIADLSNPKIKNTEFSFWLPDPDNPGQKIRRAPTDKERSAILKKVINSKYEPVTHPVKLHGYTWYHASEEDLPHISHMIIGRDDYERPRSRREVKKEISEARQARKESGSHGRLILPSLSAKQEVERQKAERAKKMESIRKDPDQARRENLKKARLVLKLNPSKRKHSHIHNAFKSAILRGK